MDADVGTMSREQLREEMARGIRQLETMRQMVRDLMARIQEIERLLLHGPDHVRMSRDEGIPTKWGVLKRHSVRKGRAWVITAEVDKDAGELGDLAPQKDSRVVIEHLSDIPTALAAELLTLSRGEDAPVKVTEKAKYPTVAQLRGEFGQETKYVGNPPTEHHVVLSMDAGDMDPTLLGTSGLL